MKIARHEVVRTSERSRVGIERKRNGMTGMDLSACLHAKGNPVCQCKRLLYICYKLYESTTFGGGQQSRQLSSSIEYFAV